jgi:gamma-glutamylcysteine synthetase
MGNRRSSDIGRRKQERNSFSHCGVARKKDRAIHFFHIFLSNKQAIRKEIFNHAEREKRVLTKGKRKAQKSFIYTILSMRFNKTSAT